jgi:hypothetical protein
MSQPAFKNPLALTHCQDHNLPEKPPSPTAALTTSTAAKPTGKLHALSPLLDIHLNHLLNGLSYLSPSNVLFLSFSFLRCSLRSLLSARSFSRIPSRTPTPSAVPTAAEGLDGAGEYVAEDSREVEENVRWRIPGNGRCW